MITFFQTILQPSEMEISKICTTRSKNGQVKTKEEKKKKTN